MMGMLELPAMAQAQAPQLKAVSEPKSYEEYIENSAHRFIAIHRRMCSFFSHEG
jgi:hypothetical protein